MANPNKREEGVYESVLSPGTKEAGSHRPRRRSRRCSGSISFVELRSDQVETARPGNGRIIERH